MNIVFVCGCLEPGRDGVGDYTRRLAAGLQKQGHIVSCLALNDHFIQGNSPQQQTTDSVITIRIPYSIPKAAQDTLARQWVAKVKPDWISLQFVPFSFSDRGLPVGLGKRLAAIGQGCKWHLMVHELWVGMATSASFKHLAWSAIQRYLVKRLVVELGPTLIHTQLQLYKLYLAKLCFNSHYLPLFANISLSKQSYQVEQPPLSLLVFGTIHPGNPIEKLAKDAARYSIERGQPVRLVFVGRCGQQQQHWAAVWQRAGMPVEVLGEQTPEAISQTLYNSTLGITTTPIPLIGKSGTVAAMLEHGLPVLCISPLWQPRGIDEAFLPPSGVHQYTEGHFEEYLIDKLPLEKDSKVRTVALQFSRDLLAVSQ